LVLNDATVEMPSFSQFFDSVVTLYQSVDADKNKIGFSRLVDLLARCLVNKVLKFSKDILNVITVEAA
jgi:hypothetical protein